MTHEQVAVTQPGPVVARGPGEAPAASQDVRNVLYGDCGSNTALCAASLTRLQWSKLYG